MKITARNYAAQAERGLRKVSALLNMRGCDNDATRIINIADEIGKAVHFVLPDRGRVLEDGLRGLTGIEMRLPFPSITASYYTPNTAEQLSGFECAPHKITLFAKEMLQNEQWVIQIYAVHDLGEFWSAGIHCGQVSGIFSDESKIQTALVTPEFTAADISDGILSETDRQRSKEGFYAEIAALFELLEALSCSNVTHEPIEKINPAVNARRIRDGKLPLYETRCLIINAGKQTAAGTAHGGTHNSPRQHLRRGHIRRLPSGNIWVNSCVVAANSLLGKIDKSYAVTA